MDVKLDSLIEKIKKDGIEEAKKIAREIIDDAKQQATKIIDEASSKADKLKEDSQKQIEGFKNNAENSLKQAARDLILSLKEQIADILNKVFKERVAEEMTPEFIKKLIIKIADNLPAGKEGTLEVLISEKETKKLKDFLIASLKKQGKDIEIKTSKTIDRGFRIGVKGDNIHYDFTDQAIMEALGEFLNPTISEMLKINNG